MKHNETISLIRCLKDVSFEQTQRLFLKSRRKILQSYLQPKSVSRLRHHQLNLLPTVQVNRFNRHEVHMIS
uniref:Uncharacterized protein n=1 Tax=Physcomitrium patens TaxID=3218 RepID=A0A2K1II75_PHYPA|nr:hypothetical protein PHYPA_027660 [Physcomitrium patens]